MKKPKRRAPASLPPAISDLVAEGGNVLTTDDAPPPRPEPDEHPAATDVPVPGAARGAPSK